MLLTQSRNIKKNNLVLLIIDIYSLSAHFRSHTSLFHQQGIGSVPVRSCHFKLVGVFWLKIDQFWTVKGGSQLELKNIFFRLRGPPLMTHHW